MKTGRERDGSAIGNMGRSSKAGRVRYRQYGQEESVTRREAESGTGPRLAIWASRKVAGLSNIGPVPLRTRGPVPVRTLSGLKRLGPESAYRLRASREGGPKSKCLARGEDRSDVGGAAQFNNIGPVPLPGAVPLSRRRILERAPRASKTASTHRVPGSDDDLNDIN